MSPGLGKRESLTALFKSFLPTEPSLSWPALPPVFNSRCFESFSGHKKADHALVRKPGQVSQRTAFCRALARQNTLLPEHLGYEKNQNSPAKSATKQQINQRVTGRGEYGNEC